jgi:hypothetical protein
MNLFVEARRHTGWLVDDPGIGEAALLANVYDWRPTRLVARKNAVYQELREPVTPVSTRLTPASEGERSHDNFGSESMKF